MDSTNSRSEILNSWKEVAQYLGRGVRTVQRWEHDLGLPVRRPRGKARSAVIALRDDLDDWLNNRPYVTNHEGNGIEVSSQPVEAVTEIIVASQDLRCKTRELSKELSVALRALISNLERIQGTCGNGDSQA